jgi:RNA polymerase sigma-70 factor (ECF subfamily)
VSRGAAHATVREVWVRHLFDRYEPPLLRYATSRLRDRLDAEEVVLETFVTAAGSLDAYQRERGTPRMWLYGLIQGLILNRRRARYRRLAHEELGAESIEANHDPAPAIDGTLSLLQAVALLPDDLQNLWWLRRVEGLTQEEAAAALEIPSGTAATRLQRADRMLYAILYEDASRQATPLLLAVGATGGLDPRVEREIPALQQIPSRDEREREALWERIRQRIGAVVPTPAAPRTRSWRSSASSHLFAAALGAASAWAARRPPHDRPPAAAPFARVAPAPSPMEAFAATSPRPGPDRAAEAPAPADPPVPPEFARRPTARLPAAVAAATDDDALAHHLRRARNALQRRDPGSATAALDDARRVMAPGESREYVDSLSVEAAALDDVVRARELLRRFEEVYPGSPHLARLRRL